MEKCFSKLSIFFVICFFMGNIAVFGQTQEGEVLTATAKIYKTNSEKSAVVITLSRGDVVNILESKGDWYKVSFGKVSGWIKKNIIFVRKTESETKPEYETETHTQTQTQTPSYYYSSERLGIGIRGGLSIASLHGADAENLLGPLSLRFGYGVGLYYILKINNDLNFQPELIYMQKGACKGDSTYQFDYIELPLLLRIKIPPLGSINAHAHLGPSFAYNIKKQLITKDKQYYYTDMNKLDIGILLGLGLSFDLSIIQVDMDIRYNYGLLKIQNSDNPFDIKCHNLFLTIGLIY